MTETDFLNAGLGAIMTFAGSRCRWACVLSLLAGLSLAFNTALATCVSSASSLIGWWPGDTNAKDIAATNHGSFVNQAAAGATGFVGGAFNFDGDWDFVAIPDSPALRPQYFTMEAWVNPERLPGQHFVVIKESGTGYSFALTIVPGALPALHLYLDGNGWSLTGTTPVPTNQWTHLAASYDGLWVKLYVNGVRVRQGPLSGTLNQGSGILGIGGGNNYAFDFAGKIDEVSLYNWALTEGEVASIFSAGAAGKCKAPDITAQPQSQSVSVGSNVTFSVSATGFGTLHYQWNFNGTNLANATNATLGLTNLQTIQTGIYSVVVTNSLGSVTSAVVTLTVTAPFLQVTSHPENQVVLHGGTAVFTANGDGWPAPAYQWQRHGTNLLNNGRVTGANSPTLTIASAQMGDMGSYRLVVSNSVGTTNSSDANLTVVPLRVWGNNFFGQTNIPLTMTNVVAAAAGSYYNLVLKDDGIITGWGFGNYFQTAMPWGLYNPLAIAAANGFSMAVAGSGQVWAWGLGDNGQTLVPPSAVNAAAVSGGGYHCLALKQDGSIVGWGYNNSGQASPPAGTNFVAVAAGGYHSAALRNDGTVIGFGNNYPYGQATPPVGLNNVVAIAAGADHCLALRNDGTVAAWGDNYYGQASIPFGLNNVTAIAAGHFHNLALKRDGSIVVWGDNSGGQAVAPAGLSNVVAVSGGNFHSLALLENPTVQTPPTLVWQPTDRTAVKDQTTLFRPQLTGSLPMKYQWSFNGTPLAAQTNAWLLLNMLQTNQAGGYQLVATNNYGAVTSAVAMLNVILVPPSITQQPQGADRPVGSSFTFSSAVAGSSPLNYQWFFNDTPLPGQTLTSLSLVNLQTNQSGSYWLTASNVAGVATSQVAVLSVGFPPGIVLAPSNSSVVLNSNLVLAVVASGSGPLAYQWRRNYGSLTDDARIHGATNDVLIIEQISTGDLGNYDVIVSSPYGQLSTPLVSLTLLYPPTITANPTNRTVPAGTNVSFSVTTSGTTPFAYQWRFNTADLPTRTNASLTLTNVQSASIGDYSVVVSNPYGVATSGVATLTVLPAAPLITTQAVSRVASVGQTVSFIVAAKGSEPMTCQWQFNGTNLPGANSFALALTNVNSSFAGTYRAAVSNAVGFVFSTNVTLGVSPVLVWGLTNDGQALASAAVPASATNVIALAAGQTTDLGVPCMALRSDGSIVTWGNFSRDALPPTNAVDLVAVSVGASGATANNLALRSDGTVVNWTSSFKPPPALTNGNFVAIAAGAAHQLALRDDGTVLAWGSNTSGQTNVPPSATNVIAIAAGANHSLALRSDGAVVGWGLNSLGQATALSNAVQVVAISAGGNQSLGLLADGKAVGLVVTNSGPQVTYYGPPPLDATNLTAITAGSLHSLGLRKDGTVTGWGRTNFGTLSIPDMATNVLALAAGGRHNLALVSDPFAPPIPPRIARPPLGRALKTGDNVVFNALGIGGLPLHFQWMRNGEPLAARTNQWLALTSAHPSEAGDYQLVVVNDFGSATSAVATVTVSIPQPMLVAPGMVTNGFRFTFASVTGLIYVVEFKDSLSASVWAELERRFGVGGLEIVTDTSANGLMRFYRVRALYAPSPKLSAATLNGGAVNFSFATVAGAQYIVEYTDRLAAPQWNELQTISGTGGEVQFSEPSPTGPQRFYRLRMR